MLNLHSEEVLRQAIRNNAWTALRAELESACRYKSTKQTTKMLVLWDAMVASIMELDDFPMVLSRKPIYAVNGDYDVDDYDVDDYEIDDDEDDDYEDDQEED